MTNWNRQRFEGAERYAQGDRSDPFAAARVQAHMRNGVCGFRPAMLDNHTTFPGFPWIDEDNPRKLSTVRPQGFDAFYTAVAKPEGRSLPDGREYFVTVYHSMVRP